MADSQNSGIFQSFDHNPMNESLLVSCGLPGYWAGKCESISMYPSKFRRVASLTSTIENQALRDLPTALSWLERARPDLARLLDSMPVHGLATATGVEAETTTLRQVVRNPGEYRVSVPEAWSASLRRLGQGIKRLGRGSAILEGIGGLIEGFNLVTEAAKVGIPTGFALNAAQTMPTPGSPGSTTNPTAAINALHADPSMAAKGDPGQALQGYRAPQPPLVTMPDVYAPDPMSNTNFSALSQMVQSPNNFRYDNTGGIQTPSGTTPSKNWNVPMQGTPLIAPNYVSTPNYYVSDPMAQSNKDNFSDLTAQPSGYKFNADGYILAPK
ncbi:hypothetical protein [Capsulimonas corticalis]|nr:hypothetical protein [Capsulimonas corticalis]